MKNLENLVSGIALAVMLVAVAAVFAGCSTDVNVYGNNNSIDTSPAKYAGYGGTIDVLKGMSLPGIGLGGGKSEKTPEETKAALPVVTEEKPKNAPPAVVETPTVSVTNDKIIVKESEK
ncbi:MAG: hypothetical protein MJ016_02155 [Victivallaceae bacterium]|nr:hypothetical protein [Victivallaceae bacterium]